MKREQDTALLHQQEKTNERMNEREHCYKNKRFDMLLSGQLIIDEYNRHKP